MTTPRVSRRFVAAIGFAGFLLYAAWIGWPYLESVIVRDAAVTSWISIAPAPISGYITNELYPGMRVGPNGRLATITEVRPDERDLAHAQAELIRANGAVEVETAVVNGMRRSLGEREAHGGGFAAALTRDIDVTVAGTRSALSSLEERLEIARSETVRLAKLRSEGVVSQSALETSRANVSELEHRVSDTHSELERVMERREAAEGNVFVLHDASDANSTFRDLADARVRMIEAEASLIRRRAERDAARVMADAAQKAFDKSRSLDVEVPPGAMVWSLIGGPGAPVQPGAPVASWVDCRVMLVDVPLSDVETSLLRPGAPADIVLEGEKTSRHGVVMLTRGSAGTLGSNDLAAIAKGRRAGIGQAIVKLTPSAADIETCGIGRAAHVDFPEIGVVDLVRARLRW